MISTRVAKLTLAFQAFSPASGKEEWKSHHAAGREALRRALESQGIKAEVSPDAEHGYLNLTQGNMPMVGLFANVSHTGGLAVGAISPAAVGVDVEALSRDPGRALERQMSEEDRRNLEKLPKLSDPRLSGALLLWTAKEAFAKALGLGMQAGMPRLQIDILGPLPYRARTEVKGHHPLKDPRIHWEIRGDFLVTVCTEAAVLAAGINRVQG